MMNRKEFEKKIRIGLADALLKFNEEILQSKDKEKKILANKICLKFIDIFLNELEIDWHGKTR